MPNTPWTAQAVAKRFEEAIATLKKLPPVKVRGYFNLWPDVGYHPNELLFQEPVRLKLRANPDAISRLDETLTWLQWVTVEERKLLWQRAAKVRWKTICWELGCDRSTAWRKWLIACTKISSHLNASQG